MMAEERELRNIAMNDADQKDVKYRIQKTCDTKEEAKTYFPRRVRGRNKKG